MIDFFINNWMVLIGVISTPLAYFFGGKKRQKMEALTALQTVYDKYIEHDKQRTEAMEKRIEQLEEFNRKLQNQFNEINIQYALVIEQSKDWEQKYKELSIQSKIRSNVLLALQKDYEKLKKDFENYKKKHP